VQGREGCCGECLPDAPCYRCFKTTAEHPGMYVIDTTTTKQPKQAKPQHLLRTCTTVNVDRLTVASTEKEGPMGEPTIEVLEELHVRCHHLPCSCSTCIWVPLS
jgi:hypothetical protein